MDLADLVSKLHGESSAFLAETVRRAVEQVYVFGALTAEGMAIPNRVLTANDLRTAMAWVKEHRHEYNSRGRIHLD